MKVLLGLHFRNDPSGVRGEIFKRVREILERLYRWDEVKIFDSGHSKYNRAASRNMAAKYAKENGFDIVVINDADSIPQATSLSRAIYFAYMTEKIVVPFNEVKVLPQNVFMVKPRSYDRIKPLYQYGESFGGIYVTQPGIWEYVGGMDERIEGWGFEDQIILSAARTFLGGPQFEPGYLYAINHLRDMTSLNYEPNDTLIRRYHASEGLYEEFRDIQRGSNDFCPD